MNGRHSTSGDPPEYSSGAKPTRTTFSRKSRQGRSTISGGGDPNRPGTDWGDEVAGALGIVGRVFTRILSYLCNVLLTLLLIGIMTGAVVGGAFMIYVKNYIDPDLESFDLLVTDSSMTTKIYYMDYTDRENRIGTPVELEDQRLYGTENRMWVSYSDIPENLVNAFVATEDHRFWDHDGVDWITTIKATLNYFTGISGRSFGASTITQQLIKNVTGDDEVTIQRKVQEILRALELEKTKDKTEILELYLNMIFLSQRSYGVQAAAYTYFGKDVKDLTLIECAALAAIPQYPSAYDPVQHPEDNANRRDEAVLKNMLKYGYITQAEFDGAYGKTLVLNLQTETETETATNSWYTDEAIRETINLLMENRGVTYTVAERMVYTSGLYIYTVMDPEVQNVLEEVFADDSNFQQASGIIQPESAMTIIDPSTGDIVGIAGGRGEKTANRIQNYATQTYRPPGSSIKPLTVYSPALEEGVITWGTVYDDVPLNFGDKEYDAASGDYVYTRPDGWPQNYPVGYRGLTTVADAVTRSVNTVALRVLQDLGLDTSFDYGVNKYHLSLVESEIRADGKIVTDKDYSPLGNGQLSYGVTVTEMAAAYATFDNNGVYNSPRTVIKICDSEGNVIVDNDKSGQVVISEQTASIMTKMLENVVNNGTASRITLKDTVNCAGKTGTTSQDNDRWFVGYTPYYVGAVWFGYEMPKNLAEFKVSPATLVWDTVMTKLHEKYINEATTTGTALKKFELADGIVTVTYCKDSGKLLTSACKSDPRGSRADTGYFTYSTVPTESCDCHVAVRYDKVTGGIACDDCPEENVITVGLLKVERSFPYQIYVTDAQYTWRDIGDTKACTDPSLPFYANLLPSGTYSGITLTDSGTQYNQYCKTHYDPDKPKVEETTETDYEDVLPEETQPPDNETTQSQPAEVTEETTAAEGLRPFIIGGGETTEPPVTASPDETDIPPDTPETGDGLGDNGVPDGG